VVVVVVVDDGFGAFVGGAEEFDKFNIRVIFYIKRLLLSVGNSKSQISHNWSSFVILCRSLNRKEKRLKLFLLIKKII
jgi:hypothetical protein